MQKIRPVKQQLILSHSLLALGGFILLAVFFSAFTLKLLLERANENMQAQVGSTVSQVDLEVGRMDTVLLNILYSGIVKNNFEAIVTDTEKNRLMMDAMISINGPTFGVQQINAYTLDGRMTSAGFINRSMQADISGMEWYRETLKQDGRKYISVPEEGESVKLFAGMGKQRYISVYRLFFDKYNKPIGIVEVMRDVRHIFKSASDLAQQGENAASIFVFAPDGKNVYRQVSGRYPLEVEYDELSHRLDEGISGAFRTGTGSGAFRLIYSTSEYTGWTFVMAMPERIIYRPVFSLLAVMAAVLLPIAAFMLLISNILSQRFAKPINQLSRVVTGTTLKNIGEEQWQIDSGIREVIDLAGGFRGMSRALARSVADTIEAEKQEQEARILALQAQMNPHFLYNSLTNISVMAENGMNQGIVEMCQSMSFMLRYASSAKNPVVTVGDELEYARSYLECMKIRYREYLAYEIDMHPDTKDIRILKLLVQPLVENAVKYGVTGDSTWNIRIRSYLAENGGWRISVQNGGAVFDPDKLAALWKAIRELDESGSYAQLSIKGMGLLNIYCRLRLRLGGRAVFEIHNDEDANCVTITVGGNDEGGGDEQG